MISNSEGSSRSPNSCCVGSRRHLLPELLADLVDDRSRVAAETPGTTSEAARRATDGAEVRLDLRERVLVEAQRGPATQSRTTTTSRSR
jgi:hypothetical protein